MNLKVAPLCSESLVGKWELNFFTKLQLWKSVASPRSAGLVLFPPANWQSSPRPHFFHDTWTLSWQSPCPQQEHAELWFRTEVSSSKSGEAVDRGWSSIFHRNQTKPSPWRPDVLFVKSQPHVYLKFYQQLFKAKQECNRKIHQCLMASGNPGGNNYVASTC